MPRAGREISDERRANAAHWYKMVHAAGGPTAVAGRCGVGISQVNGWIFGHREPSPEVRPIFARAIGLTDWAGFYPPLHPPSEKNQESETNPLT